MAPKVEYPFGLGESIDTRLVIVIKKFIFIPLLYVVYQVCNIRPVELSMAFAGRRWGMPESTSREAAPSKSEKRYGALATCVLGITSGRMSKMFSGPLKLSETQPSIDASKRETRQKLV